MDINKIMNTISKSNVDQKEVFSLIEMASSMNLKDEKNIRILIQKGCKIANKSITKDQEDRMVQLIMKKGITPELLSVL